MPLPNADTDATTPKYLRDKYSIVGVGETTYTRGSGRSTRALGTWAIRNAMIDAGLRSRRPCRAQVEAGVPRSDRNDTCYIADLAVTCRPHERGAQLVRDPILIVEVLSPGTERHDRRIKVPAYREIESVQEILLIDSDSYYAEVHRRDADHWIIELVRGNGAILSLSSVGLSLSMAELYDGIAIPNIEIEYTCEPSPMTASTPRCCSLTGTAGSPISCEGGMACSA